MGPRIGVVVGSGLVVTALLAACAPGAGNAEGLPPEGGFDYQLGGAYPPPDGVEIVVRDSSVEPEPDLYSVCYVNGFQTQPGDLGFWEERAPDVLLRDEGGDPVADPGWPDEYLLDTSTEELRERIAALLDDTIAQCAEAGYDAVEFDNLDAYLRSYSALTSDDNLALATLLVASAHDRGMAAAQKNTVEEAERGKDEVGFDFAITESCAAWSECGGYTRVYGEENVLAIEYPEDLDEVDTDFDAACAVTDTPARTILRDLALVAESEPGYVYATC
ncbi:endo alpha-1,4 polygalactosaminidase [Nocardiopsis sp. MG754419]|uniref:endo alpha-1,4 polygalactosaminidase n=1 Tax=Nocardiopsis sp. MG754419 TaxID=2259865 RepID=UPI0027DDC7DF|nr:endo alpha-1,4 polygalactosaminidase [Nocardiopsis sp. MG754419]